MPKVAKKSGFYAVARGQVPGVYQTWDDCEAQILRYPGARHKKFATHAEAVEWIKATNPGVEIASEPAEASTSNNREPSPLPRHQSMQAGRGTKGKEKAPDATHTETPGHYIIYTDGACKGNGQQRSDVVAGVGVYWGPSDPRNLAERCPGVQTNNRAELIAVARALELAPRDKIPVEIVTDSQYTINCIKNWLPGWRTRGFKTADGKAVKNVGVIKYIDALLSERGLSGQKVVFKHVRGHVGIEGNEAADTLANQGCVYPETPDRDWDTLERTVLERMRRSPTPEAEIVPATIIDLAPKAPRARSSTPIPIRGSSSARFSPVKQAMSPRKSPPVTPTRSKFWAAASGEAATRAPSSSTSPVKAEHQPAHHCSVHGTSGPRDLRDMGVQTLLTQIPSPPSTSPVRQPTAARYTFSAAMFSSPPSSPPKAPIPQAELDAYADCLLDDSDIENELKE